MNEQALTATQIAKLFGKNPRTVRHWRKHHNLPYHTEPAPSGSRTLYLLTEVLPWAEANGVPMRLFENYVATDGG